MADSETDRIKRALDKLRGAPFSRVVNAFVLPSDVFYDLVGILEGDVADNEPDDAEPDATSTPKKGATPKKRR
jgi:hypothetical protein